MNASGLKRLLNLNLNSTKLISHVDSIHFLCKFVLLHLSIDFFFLIILSPIADLNWNQCLVASFRTSSMNISIDEINTARGISKHCCFFIVRLRESRPRPLRLITLLWTKRIDVWQNKTNIFTLQASHSHKCVHIPGWQSTVTQCKSLHAGFYL